MLLEQYQRETFPKPEPTALEAVKFRMDQMGAQQSGLAALLGSKCRASELLRGKRRQPPNAVA